MRKEVLLGYTVCEDGTIINKAGKVLSTHDNGRGYLITSLRVDGKRKTFAIHRLLALAFIPNPSNLGEVNHIDGNKLNNALDNLEWTTRGANIKHAYDNNLRSASGEKNARCKTTEETVRAICELLQQGLSSAEVRDKGFEYRLVGSIKRRKNWTYISKDYSF